MQNKSTNQEEILEWLYTFLKTVNRILKHQERKKNLLSSVQMYHWIRKYIIESKNHRYIFLSFYLWTTAGNASKRMKSLKENKSYTQCLQPNNNVCNLWTLPAGPLYLYILFYYFILLYVCFSFLLDIKQIALSD